jgi:hypothetical protein
MIGGCTDLPTAAPDYIHMSNQDTLVNAGAIGALVEFLETHPHGGIAGSSFEKWRWKRLANRVSLSISFHC